MPSPLDVLTPLLRDVVTTAFGEDYRETDPVLRPSQFADVQANLALALAKRVGLPPREVASRIVEALGTAGDGGMRDIASRVEISGPGFLNITLDERWVARSVEAMAGDDRLGVPRLEPLVVPVDYSSPNIAKEMHVGHLRTTVVGDSLARTLEHLGRSVVRQNHVGDWGTGFGMLIEHLLDVGADSAEAGLLATDPNRFYQAARAKFDGTSEQDRQFATRSRARVVALQAGDPQTLALWREIVERSMAYLHEVYATLGVTLTDDDLDGESSYNDELAGICDELEERGIAVISDGALCIFDDRFIGREDKPVPLIIRKSDGGFGYATTDLATIRRRVSVMHADQVVYVVGAPQALHFEMVWAAARRAGWLPESVTCTHVKIGNVLGKDKKILRTRSGDSMPLRELLDGAVERARSVIDESRPDLSGDLRAQIAQQIGIGAVKYADLSVAHDSEYVFDLDRMVSLTGSTGPYLQYATARVRSIFRQIGLEPAEHSAAVVVREPAERSLALHLLDFGSVVEQAGTLYEPHRLVGYLFELAQLFSGFYESCPVLKADDDAVRASRLTLCATTYRVLRQGLDLLGIETPEQM